MGEGGTSSFTSVSPLPAQRSRAVALHGGAFGNQCNLIISDHFSTARSLKSSADLSWALEREKPKPKLALS